MPQKKHKQQITPSQPDVSPEQALLDFFVAVEKWEDAAFESNHQYVEEARTHGGLTEKGYRKFRDGVSKTLQKLLVRHCTQNCIPDRIFSIRQPSLYGRKGEKVVGVEITGK